MAKDLADIRDRLVTIEEQANELAGLMGQPWQRVSIPDDEEGIDDAAMKVYRQLESVRDEGDRVQWERTKGEDGRTGDDLLDRLDKLLDDLHPAPDE